MNTPDLSTAPSGKPERIVRDECWELVTRMTELAATQAVFPGLLARGKSLPMHRALEQSCRVHASSSTHCEQGEQS
ncbi:hypothetical protein ACFVAQ_20280 [Streptomyces sp. NPDC057651]|uniref:hypothetical protein n=1 Tax=Streptomyces sp. NPDC057651 TaxID=3346194 RepID=UPI0036BDBE31